ncbi:MAG: segregation/condensation protein A [Gammaproteobacteria bacterium]|nr:segregation/condensation protein A [Gammaproteobacteria bacterium]
MNTDEVHSPQPGSQGELPFAVVQGEPLTSLPRDLYIPPDALEVILDAFEGPLDLLLYLIRRHNLDVLDIPIAEITRQYIRYIELMQELKLDLAGEYLLMAAMLAEIKSRMLLPRPEEGEEDEEEDPRAELVRRLQEYERYKQAAEDIDALARVGRDRFAVSAKIPGRKVIRLAPQVSFESLLESFSRVMRDAARAAHHHIATEPISIRQRMSDLLARIRGGAHIAFAALIDRTEGRQGIVINFLALLELARTGFASLTQAGGTFAPLYVQARGLSDDEFPEIEDAQDTAAGDAS